MTRILCLLSGLKEGRDGADSQLGVDIVIASTQHATSPIIAALVKRL